MSHAASFATSPETPLRSSWRFFPLGLIAALGVVIIVNLGMVYVAIATFPGEIVHTMHK